jgi:hypothetical protein
MLGSKVFFFLKYFNNIIVSQYIIVSNTLMCLAVTKDYGILFKKKDYGITHIEPKATINSINVIKLIVLEVLKK